MPRTKSEPWMPLTDAAELLGMDETELGELVNERSEHMGMPLGIIVDGEEMVLQNFVAALKEERDRDRDRSDRPTERDRQEVLGGRGRDHVAREMAVHASRGDPQMFKVNYKKALDDLPLDPEPITTEPEVDVEAVASERAVARCTREGEPNKFHRYFDEELKAVRTDEPLFDDDPLRSTRFTRREMGMRKVSA